MARPKQKAATERADVSVGLRLVPMYGVTFDHPQLRGHTAVGATPEAAMVSARRLIADRFPHGLNTVTTTELNPDTFAKAGVHFVQD